MNFYRVAFRVRPEIEHPRNWDWSFGFLSLFLFATSEADARDRAQAVVAVLPYEIVGMRKHCGLVETTADKARIVGGDIKPFSPTAAAIAEKNELIKSHASDALHIGISLFLESYETGADEPENFEEN